MKRKYVDEEGECIQTGRIGVDLHHIASQKAHGRIDETWNLIPITHEIHQEWHTKWDDFMCNKYASIKNWMIENGWYKLTDTKWFHDGIARHRAKLRL